MIPVKMIWKACIPIKKSRKLIFGPCVGPDSSAIFWAVGSGKPPCSKPSPLPFMGRTDRLIQAGDNRYYK